MPGGPWTGGRDQSGRFNALEDQEVRVHHAWMQGWHAGFQKLYPDPAKRPSWYRPLRGLT